MAAVAAVEVHPAHPVPVVAVVHRVHTIPLSKALTNLEVPVKDRVRVENLAKARVKDKVRATARRAVENVPLATVQVWVQAPVPMKVAKVKEKARDPEIREMAPAKAENRAKAKDQMEGRAKAPEAEMASPICAVTATARDRKRLSTTFLTTSVRRACPRLRRLPTSRLPRTLLSNRKECSEQCAECADQAEESRDEGDVEGAVESAKAAQEVGNPRSKKDNDNMARAKEAAHDAIDEAFKKGDITEDQANALHDDVDSPTPSNQSESQHLAEEARQEANDAYDTMDTDKMQAAADKAQQAAERGSES